VQFVAHAVPDEALALVVDLERALAPTQLDRLGGQRGGDDVVKLPAGLGVAGLDPDR
jgi:hypothetical protein